MNFYIYTFLCVLPNLVLCAKLPAGFQICKQSDPNINNCLKDAVQNAFKIMANGLPDFKIFPIEPLFLPNLTIGQGAGAVHVEQRYKDVNIYNLSSVTVDKVEISFKETIKFRSELLAPEFALRANYNFNGRLLLLPIKGIGKCTIKLYDVKAVLAFTAERFNKKGKLYMKVVDFTVSIKPTKVYFNFENLFNGDERLGKELNKVMNDNWKEVFDDIGSGYEVFLASVGKHITNSIFVKTVLPDVFPL